MLIVMRLVLFALAAVIALAGASGCGGGGSADVGSADVAKAADATRAAGSARTASTVNTSIPQSGQNVTVTGRGVLDLRSRRANLQATISGIAALGQGGQAQLDEVLDPPIIYIRSPLFAQIPQARGKWLRIDLQTAGEKLGFNFSQLLNSSSSDPAQAVNYLKATSGSVKKLGTETIRGEATTHYRATVDLNKYPDVVPSDQRDAARKNIQALAKLTGVKQVPEDVWLDGHRRVRRVHFVETLKPTVGPLAGQNQRLDVTTELYDFGAPVSSIKPPPASDTVDASKLLKGGR